MVMKTRSRNLAGAPFNARVRTLIVDDSPRTVKVIAQTLKDVGNFDLVGAAIDERQALPYVSALYPDLVLMDIHMPRLNGLHATQSIKQRERPPVLIIVSSDDGPITRSRAEQAGADGFISKAGDLRDRLIAMLQDLFGQNGEQPAAARGIAFQDLHAAQQNQNHST
jgi:CheY-like chemotaxis protein